MTCAGGSVASRFSFSSRAQPLRLRDAEQPVYGYAWLHPEPLASVVLVHGLQSHSQWFAEAADLLLDRGLSVYAIDRRGSGASPEERGHIDRYTEWFEEVAHAVRLAQSEQPGVPVHLAGHCFGANVALGCVLTQPIDVCSLIMLTPGLYVQPDYTRAEKIRIVANGVIKSSARFRVPQHDDLFTRDPEVLAWIRGDSLGVRTLTGHCLLEINAMVTWLRRHAKLLQIPLLVFEATRDRIAHNARNRALLDGAIGRRVRWVSLDAEHFLLAEPCRDQVLDELTNWVSEQVGG
jgi:alpha-beta hydrolase superfamily lysophospholipase